MASTGIKERPDDCLVKGAKLMLLKVLVMIFNGIMTRGIYKARNSRDLEARGKG